MEPGPLVNAKYDKTRAARRLPVVTPQEARDAVEGCYCMTHFRYVNEHAARIEAETSEAALVAVIERLYRQAFGRLGYNYDQPTRAQLQHVLAFLDRDLLWAKIDPALAALHQQICGEVIARMPEDGAPAQPSPVTPRL
ncbi:MAG: hypothetical protein M3Z04_08835 [Chloroflexota bacterium]|nr:hypothetical protein [Chloroflexota bacterium]